MKVASVFLGLGILFFTHIGNRPLANPDEGRYASMGLEMIQTNDWIVPRLNSLIYFEKPPLAYWSIALGQKLFGETLLGSRFFNALFSLLTCLSLYLFCNKFLSKKVALWAAFIYGSSALPFGMSQMLTLDNALTFFLTATLLLFASGFLTEDLKQSKHLFLWAYAFMPFTVLTKGLIGIVFPGLIGGIWLCYTGHIRKLPKAHLVKGLLLFFLIAAPWHLLVQQRHNCFFNFYFWHEHFERYLTSVHNRTKPLYFLPLSFLIGLIPWLFFLPRTLHISLKQTKTTLEKHVISFSLIWAVCILGFFTYSKSQLIPYILPAISGITILIAFGISKLDLKKTKVESILWGISFIVAACVLSKVLAKKALVPVPSYLILLAQTIIISGSLIALCHIKNKPLRSFYSLLGTTLLIYILLPIYLPYCQRLCGQNICEYIRKQSSEKVDVFCAYNYFNDLPFYLKKTVGTIDCVPEEHELGYKEQHPKAYMSSHDFRKRLQASERCYAVVKRGQEAYFESVMSNYPIYKLTQDPYFSLYSNQP